MIDINALIQSYIDGLMAPKDAQIAALGAQIEGLGADIATKSAQIAQIQGQIAGLTLQINDLTALIGAPPPILPVSAEMVVKGWFQETVPPGKVAAWTSSGVKGRSATQQVPDLQPTKLANNGGILFAKNTLQTLAFPPEGDAPWLHRWWVAIAKSESFTQIGAVDIACVNGSSATSTYARQPRLFFKNGGVISSQVIDTAVRSVENPGGFGQWNVLVGWRRGYEMQQSVNGVRSPVQQVTAQQSGNQTGGFFGASTAALLADLTVDCVVFGQSELTDAQIDRLVGWGMWRAGRQVDLPADHPYRSAPPADVDEPSRYAFSQTAWDAWKAQTNAIKATHRAEPAPSTAGYVTVFEDNFATNSIVDHTLGPIGSNWYAPTHLGSIVGVDALAQKVTDLPSTYVHDPVAQTMSLRLVHNGSNWRTGCFASVDLNGQGRTWGKGIFEIRCKFPLMPTGPRPGFFPAFWAYGRDQLFWRTRNRLETDFWEYDGLNGAYINVTQLVHASTLPYAHPDVLVSDVSTKMFGYEVSPTNGFPAKIDIYDGQYHTWYFQIEDDLTYMVLDGLEVGRCPTVPELTAQKYIMVDFAYRSGQGVADKTKVYDMTIDYIRVRQKP